MKKLMTMALILLMGAAACQKETPDYTESTTPTDGDYVAFTADFSTLASKAATSFDEQSKALTLSWEAGDQVGVYSSQTPILYKATAAGASTTLTTNIKVATASSYSAVYPYLTDALMEDGRLALNIPAEQSAVADELKYHVAVAKTSSKAFSFKNVTAAVRLHIMADNVTKVEVKGNAGELVAGDIKVNTENASFSGLLNGDSKVTLLPAAGSSVIEPGIYYASLIPQNLSQGLTVTYYVGENSFEQKNETAIALDGNTLIVCDSFGISVEGSESNPFQVGSVTDLQGLSAKLALNVPNYVVMTKDIDMAGVTSWTPISNSRTAATVPEIHFDGKGHAIKNFAPTSITPGDGGTQAGFFGTLCGSCKNLTFTDVALTVTSNTAGVLAGFVGVNDRVPTVISSVSLSGSISGAKVLGGLCGNITNALVENSTTSLTVTATDAEAGGFAGRLESNVKFVGCSATGDVRGARAAGCFAGGSNTTKDSAVNSGKIEFVKCSATGDVTGTYQMAAFVGHVHTTKVSFEDCYALGNVETTGSKEGAAKQIGGLVGVNSGAELTITRCFYVGALSKGYIEVGGILGVDASGSATISSSFAVAEITTNTASKQNGGIVGMARATKTTITDCYAGGSISSAGTFGGILGEASTSAHVKNCVWGGSGTDAIVGAGVVPENSTAVTEADKPDYATPSKIATKLGWSNETWDLSGSLPVLK